MAGGVSHTADTKKTRIIHNFNGAFDAEELPLRQIERGEMPDQLLHANDVIFVPFSFAKHVVMGTTAIVASASSALIYAGY